MTRSSKLLFLFLLLLFVGCSTTSDVVGKGPFQKRKYRPGWDLSALRAPHHNAEPRPRLAHERMSPMTLRVAQTWPAPEPAEPLSASIKPMRSANVLHGKQMDLVPSQDQLAIISEVKTKFAPSTESVVTGDRRWNRMALVSGVFLFLAAVAAVVPGGAGILLYLVTFAFITGIIGLVLASKNKEKGKLLAIAAIAIPLLFIVLLLTVGKNAF